MSTSRSLAEQAEERVSTVIAVQPPVGTRRSRSKRARTPIASQASVEAILISNDDPLAEQFSVTNCSAVFVIDGDGRIVWGVGMALLEERHVDPRTGRYVNADLAEHQVPVNADIGTIDVHFAEEHDSDVNPIGAKEAGEIGITGVAASIANAVYHATGKACSRSAHSAGTAFIVSRGDSTRR